MKPSEFHKIMSALKDAPLVERVLLKLLTGDTMPVAMAWSDPDLELSRMVLGAADATPAEILATYFEMTFGPKCGVSVEVEDVELSEPDQTELSGDAVPAGGAGFHQCVIPGLGDSGN